MSAPSVSARALARSVLAAARSASSAGDGSRPRGCEVGAVCEALRGTLIKFAGEDGFAALLRRALALAGAEAPGLRAVRLGANGKLEGLDEVEEGDAEADAALVLTAHLLELLITFIGEPLTARLVREGWPNVTDSAAKKDGSP